MAAPTRIITVRHAATGFNQEKRIAGTLDISLSDKGLAQARSVRDRFSRLEYDAIVSSPLKRALDTALLSTGITADAIDVREECIERDYGLLQGLTPEEVGRVNRDVTYIRVGGFEHSLDPPAGETLDLLRERAGTFRDYLFGRYPALSVVVFSHYTFLQQFHGVLLEQGTRECLAAELNFLEVSHFELEGSGRVTDHHSERPIVDEHESW